MCYVIMILSLPNIYLNIKYKLKIYFMQFCAFLLKILLKINNNIIRLATCKYENNFF